MHFYNTRDKYSYPVTSGHCPKGTTEKLDCWPMPEVRNNIDMTSGNLGLTDEEEVRCNPGQRVPDLDSASAAVRIRYLRRCARPQPAYSVTRSAERCEYRDRR